MQYSESHCHPYCHKCFFFSSCAGLRVIMHNEVQVLYAEHIYCMHTWAGKKTYVHIHNFIFSSPCTFAESVYSTYVGCIQGTCWDVTGSFERWSKCQPNWKSEIIFTSSVIKDLAKFNFRKFLALAFSLLDGMYMHSCNPPQYTVTACTMYYTFVHVTFMWHRSILQLYLFTLVFQSGASPLFLASQRNNIKTVEVLLGAGAKVNLPLTVSESLNARLRNKLRYSVRGTSSECL